jgi:hypothetical protein
MSKNTFLMHNLKIVPINIGGLNSVITTIYQRIFIDKEDGMNSLVQMCKKITDKEHQYNINIAIIEIVNVGVIDEILFTDFLVKVKEELLAPLSAEELLYASIEYPFTEDMSVLLLTEDHLCENGWSIPGLTYHHDAHTRKSLSEFHFHVNEYVWPNSKWLVRVTDEFIQKHKKA